MSSMSGSYTKTTTGANPITYILTTLTMTQCMINNDSSMVPVIM